MDTFVLRRREQPPFEEFTCAICEELQTVSEWPWSNDRESKPPICGGCSRHWHSIKTRPSHVTRGDLLALRRLSAITNRLDWETYNGRHGSLKFYAYG